MIADASELHLVILWETARGAEDRIVSDLQRHVKVVSRFELAWPGDAEACYSRFYGANLPEAKGKVLVCGGGAFVVFVVRDERPRYGWRLTSRGHEYVNLRLFGMKARYRKWTGGGHRVHTTNSTCEFVRDVFLLTGHTAAEWRCGTPVSSFEVLPGHNGWTSMRDLFAHLERCMPYAVLRNAESLPDAFDPAMHGDIDLLVPNAITCAECLGARKVFPESYRVHYEVMVAGKCVRFDFRFIGDGYYDASWQKAMLEHRRLVNGIYLLSLEDAFYALVYHALYQKRKIASDYHGKCADLARANGMRECGFDAWFQALEKFLSSHGYGCTQPQDASVFFDRRLADWRLLAQRIAQHFPVADMRPVFLASRQVDALPGTFFFEGTLNGKACIVKYSPCACELIRAEWEFASRACKYRPDLFVNAYAWHQLSDGGGFVVLEKLAGRILAELLDLGVAFSKSVLATFLDDVCAIVQGLRELHVLHRDVRPQNLMVSPDGHVKLFDFQFATELGSSAPETLLRFDFPGNWRRRHLPNLQMLHDLGESFSPAPGCWNDAWSMLKIVNAFPDGPLRERAIAVLKPLSEESPQVPVLTLSCRKMLQKDRRRARIRRIRYALLHRKKDAPTSRQLWWDDFVCYILRTWH